MIEIQSFQTTHLPQLRELLNLHVEALVPGWTLTDDYIHARLQSDPGQYVIGPWVAERQTLCAIQRDRVVGAAHLLRYGSKETVGESYRGAVDVAWFVFYLGEDDTAQTLLDTCHHQMDTWSATRRFAWDSGLSVPVCGGIPDVWPHIRDVLYRDGYRPSTEHREAVFGGTLHQIPLPSAPPADGMTIRRTVRNDRGVGYSAFIDDQEVGYCQFTADLTDGGRRPALRGWAELSELHVNEEWRRRGVATWLICHMVQWLRLAGCDRIIFSVTADDEAAAAGPFYRSIGWDAITRFENGWQRLD
jgi:GNAT superfamily N-acetyltransferase